MFVTTCAGCHRPAHASETDDDDYHPECRPLTGTTITDEQIRAMRTAILAEGARGEFAYSVPSVEALAQIALGRSELRRAARARCAEILNARAKEGS